MRYCVDVEKPSLIKLLILLSASDSGWEQQPSCMSSTAPVLFIFRRAYKGLLWEVHGEPTLRTVVPVHRSGRYCPKCKPSIFIILCAICFTLSYIPIIYILCLVANTLHMTMKKLLSTIIYIRPNEQGNWPY